jgi:predicted NAD-dependent protein-ADP-ribosyltransferase YbiA (DUF1768 family)
LRIVEEGNKWKFTVGKQSPTLKKLLMETGERELVEVSHAIFFLTTSNRCQASPRDWIWGVGFDAASAEANRANWGENLLGKAITKVRDDLAGSQL